MSFETSQLYGSRLELAGVATGVLSVALLLVPARPRLQWFTWLAGILTSGAYAVVFGRSQLYVNSLLQAYFVVVSLVGAYAWLGQLLGGAAAAKDLPTSRGPRRYVLVAYAVGLLATVPLYGVFRLTDDPAPFLDSLIVAVSGAAVWLQAKKYVECWYGWIVVDLAAVPLFASQGLGATAVLYGAYLVMCVIGLKTWRADLRRVRPAPEPVPAMGTVPFLAD
jgi:nicotinamide mononucleotide transporter